MVNKRWRRRRPREQHHIRMLPSPFVIIISSMRCGLPTVDPWTSPQTIPNNNILIASHTGWLLNRQRRPGHRAHAVLRTEKHHPLPGVPLAPDHQQHLRPELHRHDQHQVRPGDCQLLVLQRGRVRRYLRVQYRRDEPRGRGPGVLPERERHGVGCQLYFCAAGLIVWDGEVSGGILVIVSRT